MTILELQTVLLTLRDLCESTGADMARVWFGESEISYTVAEGAGCLRTPGGRTLQVLDRALDDLSDLVAN